MELFCKGSLKKVGDTIEIIQAHSHNVVIDPVHAFKTTLKNRSLREYEKSLKEIYDEEARK